MRNFYILCATGLLIMHATAGAQDQSEYEQLHQEADIERRAIVADNLQLLDSEEEAFWKMYRDYRTADKELDDQRVELVARFEESMNDVTDDKGNHLVRESLRIETQRQALKQKYFMEFSQVLPGSRLFRYYQIETKLDALKKHYWTQTVQLAPASE